MKTEPKTPISKAMDMTEETENIEGIRRARNPLVDGTTGAEVEGHRRIARQVPDPAPLGDDESGDKVRARIARF